MNEKLKRWSIWLWREWIRTLLVVVMVVGSFRSAIADWNDVPTGSMKPTILEGDRIVINKLAYDLKVPFTTWRLARWAEPRRGEIVVLYSPADGKRLVKRVVGAAGDRLALRNERLYVNDEPASYEPFDPATLGGWRDDGRRRLFATERIGERGHPVMITPDVPAMRSFGPITVPPDHVFLMGDNRDESGDSRYFGFVSHDSILGRATAVAASVDPERHYLPRWRRFFTTLP
ncbi:MAG: signal peptidase I [Acidobacteria bacterium]|nr:signal peptidase I [Acidobacteriota bacterium]